MKTSIKCPKCGGIMILTIEKGSKHYHSCFICGHTTKEQKNNRK